nr:MGS-like domain protein [uncultured bacterium]AIA13416.1 MGS-like domain protein [uncultured bacterium]
MKEVFIDNVLSSEGLSLLVKQAKNKHKLRIALISSESYKDILSKFVLTNGEFFKYHILFSTSGTATHLRSHLDLPVESVGHGPDGGDVVISYKILRRELDVLIFFRGGHEVYPHEEDIRTLLRIANMSNCIVATNIATASLIVSALSLLFTNETEEQKEPVTADIASR